MVGRSFLERRRIAQTELRDALEVLDAAAVAAGESWCTTTSLPTD
jgi:hypothetical protein